MAGQPADRRPDEQLEGHEGRYRVAGQSEQQGRRSLVGAVDRRVPGPCRTRTACPAGPRRATAARSRTPRTPARTTSYGPTDTPPETIIASAPSMSPAQMRGLRRRRAGPSRCPGRAGRHRRPRPSRRGPGRWRPGCRPGQVAGPAGGPRRRSRGSRRSGGDGPGQLVETHAGRQADRRGRQDGAGVEDPGARREVAAGSPDGATRATAVWTRIAGGSGPVASRPRGPAGPPAASSGRRLLDRDDGVGARRDRGAGRDADRRAAPDRDVGRLPGADLADHLEAGGRVLGRRRRRPRPGSRSRPSRSCPTAAARSGS